MKASHTPGPWEVDTSDKHVEIFNNIGTLVVSRIARRERLPNDDDGKFSKIELANAKLIAAAPDLLEACKEFVRKVECGEAKSKRSYQQMKDAISKATDL